LRSREGRRIGELMAAKVTVGLNQGSRLVGFQKPVKTIGQRLPRGIDNNLAERARIIR
jgi:hypothetical protein